MVYEVEQNHVIVEQEGTSVGTILGIILAIFRNRESLDVDEASVLKL